jgi:hypothetical protein
MRLTMKERQSVTKALADQYRRASKKEKGRILDQYVEATGYNRVYAARALRGHGKRVDTGTGVVLEGSVRIRTPRKPRPRVYGPEVLKALKKVWKIMDYICGKRLASALPEVVRVLVREGELRVSRSVADKLVNISPATIDRLLEPERAKAAIKGRSRTKPGTLLKHQIPVRTFADWNEMEPGFLEMDLVAHDGGSSHGEYCQILDVTDVCTGWSEQAAVPTKAQHFVFQAIQDLRARIPFDVLGLDSDNGGEFINHQLMKYCKQESITFTRSRPCKKNDNCYVEQKNWSIVRRFSGYGRFEGHEACRVLNELYLLIRDYNNFFSPSMKLVEKVRDGAKVSKRYDNAQTPYRRVLESPHVAPHIKRRLRRHYATLNPAALIREIRRLQKTLDKLAVRLRNTEPAHPKPAPNHPWRVTTRNYKAG